MSVCVCECTHVRMCVCVHEGVRLIEVVRVKMIPSGVGWGGVGGGVYSSWRRWVGSAVDDGKSDQERGMRWRGKGKESGWGSKGLLLTHSAQRQ